MWPNTCLNIWELISWSIWNSGFQGPTFGHFIHFIIWFQILMLNSIRCYYHYVNNFLTSLEGFWSTVRTSRKKFSESSKSKSSILDGVWWSVVVALGFFTTSIHLEVTSLIYWIKCTNPEIYCLKHGAFDLI